MATIAEVITFIRETCGISERTHIGPDSQIERDLGITGDDGDLLLLDAESAFGFSFESAPCSVEEAFELEDGEYLFHSECSLISFSWFFFRRSSQKVKPITVEDFRIAITRLQGLPVPEFGS